MTPGLLFFAVPQEAIPFLKMARSSGIPVSRRDRSCPSISKEWSVGPHRVVVSGMGQARAIAAARAAFATSSAEWVLSCGFAGALNPSLQLGDLLHDADPWFPLTLPSQSAPSKPAVFHCSTRVIVSRSEKARLHSETGAGVVEMESGVIRELCHAKGLPSATLRVVSDVADEDLPLDFNTLLTASHDLHPGRMAWAIARAPWKIPGLLRFQHRVSHAARCLAEAINCALMESSESPAP